MAADQTMARRGAEWPHWGRAPGRGRRSRGAGGGREGREIDGLFLLTAGFLAVTLVLGGASQGNAWQVAVLELFGLVVIGFALPRLRAQGELAALWRPLALIAAIALVPVLQLVPLPFELWASLPGRGDLAAGLREAGVAPAYLPLSLAPARTLNSMLWLLIPAAVFLGAGAASQRQRMLFVLLVVGASVVSQLLGMLQLAGMADTFRFYEISNVERPVGLFANSNHYALFVLLALPLFAGWLRRGGAAMSWRAFTALTVLAAVAVASILASHSRAGVALTVPAVIGAFAVLLQGRGVPRRIVAGGAFAVLALGVVGTWLLVTTPGMARQLSEPFAQSFRATIWNGAGALAERYAPLGSGVGSFAQVYPAAETPRTLQFTYVNHAHNDFLEVWMEAGYAGVALALVLAAWSIWLAVHCWRSRGAAATMGQGGSLAIALTALHSVVDYPARTPAVAAVLALSWVLLAAKAREREMNQ